MITKEEILKMNEKELGEELQKSKLELLKMRLGLASRQFKETSKFKILRKYIARIKTLKRMRKLDVVPENAKSAVTK